MSKVSYRSLVNLSISALKVEYFDIGCDSFDIFDVEDIASENTNRITWKDSYWSRNYFEGVEGMFKGWSHWKHLMAEHPVQKSIDFPTIRIINESGSSWMPTALRNFKDHIVEKED